MLRTLAARSWRLLGEERALSPTEPSSGTVSYRGPDPHEADADRVIWLAGDQDASTVPALIETMPQVVALRRTPRGDLSAQVAHPAGGRTKSLARRRGP